MGLRSKWVVLWSVWAAALVRQPTPELRVSSGLLRGSIGSNGNFAQYLAIPYATIVKRFQAPGPEPKWDGVFEAIEENVRCLQELYYGTKIVTGQIDCLTLNVYTPLNIPPHKKLPVMLFVHGGGFSENSGSRVTMGPDFLVKKDVVFVTINYRLNAQGFLSLGIKEAPGNAGMKDQVAALKWVKKNIRVFGGDPDNVLIFGESSGGSSISAHIVSPMSKGLFHKAIPHSGSSISATGFTYNPLHVASLLAKQMGFDSHDPHELYRYFMSKTDADLVTTRLPREEGTTLLSVVYLSPCAERIFEGEEPFLTELPYDMLSKGKFNKVPIMIGSTIQEGLFISGMDLPHCDNVVIEKALPNDLEFPSEKEKQKVCDQVKELYIGNDEISSNTRIKVSRLYGEPFFSFPAMEETELLAQHSDQPVYSYVFGYDGLRNYMKFQLSKEFRDVPGATHADDMFYILRVAFIPDISDFEMIDKMTTLLTNFAKYGNPTPEVTDLIPIIWPPVTKEDQRSLLIDQQFSTIPLWNKESLLFWKDIYSKYRKKLSQY